LTSCNKNINNPAGLIPDEKKLQDYSLEQVKDEGFVVFENSSITSGQFVWNEFVENTVKGIACNVGLAFYYTLDGQNISPEYYEEIKDDYPCLFLQDLNFDGEIYTLFSREEGEEYIYKYKYLKRFEEKGSQTAAFSWCVRYVLVNDDNVTLGQITRGELSSQSGAWIDHKVVYSKYLYKD